MPVKLVGAKVSYVGKTLWEICGNLKNFGVGRIVIKSHFLNYPEVSYFKIVNVQPVAPPAKKYANRRVMVWAEHVFRGKKYPELVQMHNLTDRTTFQLIPRSEEDKYLKAGLSERRKELPQYREFPPLMKILMEREARLLNKPLKHIKTDVARTTNSSATIKSDESFLKEKPSTLWMGTPVSELKETLERLKHSASESQAS